MREVHRLDDVAVDAKLVRADEVGLLVGGRQHHHGNQLRSVVGADPAQHLDAVHLWKLEVEHDHPGQVGIAAVDVWPVTDEVVERRLTVGQHEHPVRHMVLPQCAQRQLGVVGVVLHQQDFDTAIPHRVSP